MKGVIMAGGSASRFGRKVDKGMLLVGGRSLLDRAVSAFRGPSFDSVIAATTQRTPGTERASRDMGIEVLRTSGNGYHEDTLELLDRLGRYVSLNVDVPFANADHLTSLLGCPVMNSAAAVVPLEMSFIQPEPGSVLVGPDGRMMVWVGLNVVSDDADTGLVVLDDGLLCVNVNDDESLGVADRLAQERGL